MPSHIVTVSEPPRRDVARALERFWPDVAWEVHVTGSASTDSCIAIWVDGPSEAAVGRVLRWVDPGGLVCRVLSRPVRAQLVIDAVPGFQWDGLLNGPLGTDRRVAVFRTVRNLLAASGDFPVPSERARALAGVAPVAGHPGIPYDTIALARWWRANEHVIDAALSS